MAVTPCSPTKMVGTDEDKITKKSRLSSPGKQQPQDPTSAEPRKRTKDPGVRVVGGRIYDSENGKTCHQCRQKTRDFAAFCKRMKGNKMCTIKFCHKCLLNRYGEKAEEVACLDSWSCPKCRGICNCSFCMKKRGQQPTGILVHAAKATGYSSVYELLDHKGFEVLNLMRNASQKNSPISKKGLVAPERSCDKENYNVGQTDDNLCQRKEKQKVLKKIKKESGVKDSTDCNRTYLEEEKVNMLEIDLNEVPASPSKRKRLLGGDKLQTENVDDSKDAKVKSSSSNSGKHFDSNANKSDDSDESNILANGKVDDVNGKHLPKKCKAKKHAIKRLREHDNNGPILPQGTRLMEVAGVELLPEDVGPALQFLEFCRAFSKVLHMNKGQAESILREIARGRGRRGTYSAIVQFHINLLSIIWKDRGERPLPYSAAGSGDAWVEALGKFIGESQFLLKELPLTCFNKGLEGYNNLDPSRKLSVLNFLCDETLCTEKMRSWIDEENMKLIERRKVAKEKVVLARRKEKDLKEKLKNDMAKAMLSLREGAVLTISEHGNLISKIREETERAHVEMLETLELLPKKKQRRDAMRTEPIRLECNGQAYWKLEGHCNSLKIMLQDCENWELVANKDKWFAFDEEDEKVIERYISSSRNRQKSQNNPTKMASNTNSSLITDFSAEDSQTAL
ncbi:uncharacterized protein [Typha angustifolia]|uniref:uncharacterized protein isoform X2 n=1 Tax=Typha angustifolia TaxID=59011 RepID=UPI003C2EF6BE